MCGIYGYIGSFASFDVIKKLIKLAETRGKKQHGFSYIKNGMLFTYKNTGRASRTLSHAKRVEGAQCIIGIAQNNTGRFSGGPQPFTDGESVSVVILDDFSSYKSLFRNHDRKTPAQINSVACIERLNRSDISPSKLHRTLPTHLVLTIQDNTFYVMNKELPLYIEELPDGLIFSSRRISEKSKPLFNSFIHHVVK